ncbi:MAG: hypothetical protein Q9M14_00310 [Mariprofundaceae bacterium]|nr:hypothetical protein [Mariprofundaceae bacterium]
MALPSHLRSIAKLVSRHEIGHLIVARVLGFKTGDITITVIGPIDGYKGGSEITLSQPLSSVDEVLKYSKNRVQTLFAGALAESLDKSGKVNLEYANKCLNGDAKNDFAKARELLQIIRNIKYPNDIIEVEMNKHLNMISDDLWEKAILRVESDCELIEGLSDRLASEVHAVNTEVRLTAKAIDETPKIIERFGLDTTGADTNGANLSHSL